MANGIRSEKTWKGRTASLYEERYASREFSLPIEKLTIYRQRNRSVIDVDWLYDGLDQRIHHGFINEKKILQVGNRRLKCILQSQVVGSRQIKRRLQAQVSGNKEIKRSLKIPVSVRCTNEKRLWEAYSHPIHWYWGRN